MKKTQELYDASYYRRRYAGQSARDLHILRCQDEAVAIAYAFGVDSLEEALAILGVSGQSLYFSGNRAGSAGDHNKPVRRGVAKGWDTVFVEGEDCRVQLRRIMSNYRRSPGGVLDIGAGDCGLAIAFSVMGVPAFAFEPSEAGRNLCRDTEKALKFIPGEVSAIVYGVWHEDFLKHVNTLTFCASIEHIEEEVFEGYWSSILSIFSGRIIIVNTVTLHPIRRNGHDHVRQIDDAFYDRLVSDVCDPSREKRQGQLVFRQGSHLIMEIP